MGNTVECRWKQEYFFFKFPFQLFKTRLSCFFVIQCKLSIFICFFFVFSLLLHLFISFIHPFQSSIIIINRYISSTLPRAFLRLFPLAIINYHKKTRYIRSFFLSWSIFLSDLFICLLVHCSCVFIISFYLFIFFLTFMSMYIISVVTGAHCYLFVPDRKS